METKKSLFLIFGILILGLAVYGYFQSVPSPADETNFPRIEINPQSFDFGEVAFGQVVERVFRVKNSGSEVLEIKRVATSCACTTAQINQGRINPGEETELVAKYDTAAMGEGSHGRGKQERIIYIKSNDPANPQIEVMIYANVN